MKVLADLTIQKLFLCSTVTILEFRRISRSNSKLSKTQSFKCQKRSHHLFATAMSKARSVLLFFDIPIGFQVEEKAVCASSGKRDFFVVFAAATADLLASGSSRDLLAPVSSENLDFQENFWLLDLQLIFWLLALQMIFWLLALQKIF